jgi:hypothetical protein
MQCFSIEDEVRVRGRARDGWAHPKRAGLCRTARLIIETSAISNSEWWVGKFRAEGDSLNRPKEKARGWGHGRQDERVTCRPLSSQKDSFHSVRCPCSACVWTHLNGIISRVLDFGGKTDRPVRTGTHTIHNQAAVTVNGRTHTVLTAPQTSPSTG